MPGGRAAGSLRLVLILSENWTLWSPRDLDALVRAAVEAEQAGFDAVMIGEHVVLGRGSDAEGVPEDPRDYALPGNQEPETPWPDPLLVLAAVASATSRIRLVGSSLIAPLRHPLALAKQLATLDQLSRGRLVVQPTVSWHRAEYEALGVPFGRRGELLDEHLEAWRTAWRSSPASFAGRHYRFEDVWLEPKPYRPDGPPLWFGSTTMHDALLRRIVRYGAGFNPLGRPSDDDLARLSEGLRLAGRDPNELEMVGGTRGRFPDPSSAADLGDAIKQIPPQVARGFRTICIKPSQFVNHPGDVPSFCREVVARVDALAS